MYERTINDKETDEREWTWTWSISNEGPEGGVPVAFPSPSFFEIPLPSAQIPFPLAECGKNPSVIRIPPLFDPTKTQKFTRIYKDLLKITGSFQTVIRLSSSEFIAISPCHFTFLPFLPAGNLPSDLYDPFVYSIHLCHTFFVYFSPSELLNNLTVNSICSFLCV